MTASANRENVKKVPRENKARFSFRLTKRAILIPLFVLVTLLFAQSLKLPLSYMTFIFSLLLPLIPIFWLIMAAIFVRTAVRVSADTVEKNTPFDFVSLISNNSVIPFSLVEAELLVPDKTGAKCQTVSVALTLAPMDGCEIRRSAKFAFRGEYEIGLSNVTVTDCFGFARVRIACEHTAKITVLPRRFELPPRADSAESDLSIQTVQRTKGTDVTESSDVRAYLAGDSMKSIHWKLSSKSEELVVKDYLHNIGDSVYILCDLEAHYRNGDAPFAPIDGFEEVYDNLMTDLVVENALAATLRELRARNSAKLLWFSERGGKLIPSVYEINDMNDFDSAFVSFARAPMTDADKQIQRLSSLITDTGGASLIIVSSTISPSAVDEYLKLASSHEDLGAKGIELIYPTAPAFRKPDEKAEKDETKRLAELSGFMSVTRRKMS